MTLVEHLGSDEETTRNIAPSDETYIHFRRQVAPGLLDAGFDFTPAKSDEVAGEPDQTMYRHILNGAAFGARLNRALEALDPENALSQTELMDAFRLYAVHDFHKTEFAQRRRENSDRRNGDKDVDETRARELIDTIGLDEIDRGTDLAFKDYWASVLEAEESSGRSRSAGSKRFTHLRNWVRVMDAAGGLTDPSETEGLARRLGWISEAVTLHYHRLDDTKGLTSNLLNESLADRIGGRADAELLVYFADGALYLGTESTPDGIELLATDDDRSEEDLLPETVADEFVQTVRDSDADLTEPDTLARLLDDSAYNLGFYKFTPLTYLFGGIEGAVDALYADLVDRTDPNEYSVYTDAVRFAVGTGLIDEVPVSHEISQIVGVLIATLYDQLFKRALNGGDARLAIDDVAQALDCEAAGDLLRDGHRSSEEQITPTAAGVSRVADAFDESEADAEQSIRDVRIGGGKKTESQVLALVFLAGETEDGTDRAALTLPEALSTVQTELLSHIRDWQDHWDSHAGDAWEPDDTPQEKFTALERSLQGNLRTALPWYVRRYVSVDGDVFGRSEAGGTFDAYDRQSQARLCLTCRDQLVGDTNAMKDYEVTGSVVGRSLTFTHLRTLDPANQTEISSTVCPVCQLEFTLRNAVHGTNTDDDSRYLLLAPDYFHSPVDAAAARTLHNRLDTGDGGTLRRIAQTLVGKATGTRSEELEQIYEELVDDRDFGSYLNYDSSYGDAGALGLFRFDPISRPNGNGDVNRTTQWALDLFAATAFAWLSGSRVILSDSPIPATSFDETRETVTVEGAPAPVERHLPTESSVSFLRHVDDGPDAYEVTRRAADDATGAEDTTVRLATDFGVSLYQLAATLYVTTRAHGLDFQRVTTVLDGFDEPFPGAGTVLKEANDAPLADYSALFAATLLDTITHPDMTATMRRLAEAGFDVVPPDTSGDGDVSNYEYERLFRQARDALSDQLARSASRDDLVEIVTGVVMEAGARARRSQATDETDEKYADERYTRESAEEFAEIFVDEVYGEICDGDFYELRRLENSLASGYNAAIRRRQEEFFAEHAGNGGEGNEQNTDESVDAESGDTQTADHATDDR